MKKNELRELKRKPAAELAKLLVEKTEKLRSLRVDLAMGKSAQVKDIRELKKAVARIRTFMTEHHGTKR